MGDIDKFIDDLGADVGDVIAPELLDFVLELGKRVVDSSAGPTTTFLTKLITDVIDEHRTQVEEFVRSQVRDRFEENRDDVEAFLNKQIKAIVSRYQPELTGNLTTKIVAGGIRLKSEDVTFKLKNAKTNDLIASLDLPVDLTIKVDEMLVEIDTEDLSIKNLQIK